MDNNSYRSRMLHGNTVIVLVEGDVNSIELTYRGDFTIQLHLPQPSKGQEKPIETQLALSGVGYLHFAQRVGQ